MLLGGRTLNVSHVVSTSISSIGLSLTAWSRMYQINVIRRMQIDMLGPLFARSHISEQLTVAAGVLN